MPKSTRDWDDEFRSDGTRRSDNTFLNLIDRANGKASARKDERDRLERDERRNSGKGSWTDPFSPVDVFGKPTVFAGPGRKR